MYACVKCHQQVGNQYSRQWEESMHTNLKTKNFFYYYFVYFYANNYNNLFFVGFKGW